MSFLIFAVPIVVIIIFVIFLTVFLSDSKKYKKNLDNSKQVELDRAREAALKRVKSITEANLNPKSKETNTFEVESSSLLGKRDETPKENISQQSTFNQYEEYYKKNYQNRTQSLKSQELSSNNNDNKVKKLEFSKKNLVKGLIAKEYLNRKKSRMKL